MHSEAELIWVTMQVVLKAKSVPGLLWYYEAFPSQEKQEKHMYYSMLFLHSITVYQNNPVSEQSQYQNNLIL